MEEDGWRKGEKAPLLQQSKQNQKPRNINELVLSLNLSDGQFQSILLSSRYALGINHEQIQEGELNFSALYTAITRSFPNEAQSYLRLMLERVQYDTRDLECLPSAPVLNKNSPDRNRKLDMLLAMAVMITSMSEYDYTRFRRQLVRGESGNLKDIPSDSPNTIKSRCDLVKTLFERQYFAADNLQKVFDWLDDSHCSYPEQLVQYCNRYDMTVPREIRYWKSLRRNCRVNQRKFIMYIPINLYNFILFYRLPVDLNHCTLCISGYLLHCICWIIFCSSDNVR